MKTQFVSDAAGQVHLLRYWPASTPEPAPLLLMLDGDWLQSDIEALQRTKGPQRIHIASLGYGLDHAETAARRAFDYTPNAPGPHQIDPRVENWRCGGADDFSRFLHHTVCPLLSEALAVAPNKMGLFGHSYGGLYCLYQLFCQQPSVFNHFYAASPALWWHWPLLLQLSQPAAFARPNHLHLMVGENEQWHAKPAQSGEERRNGSPTRILIDELMQSLRGKARLHTDLSIFKSQQHGPMLSAAALHSIAVFTQRKSQ